MKKIIVAIDGLKYSDHTTRYAIQLAKKTDAHLVGVFLEDFTYHSYKIYDLVGEQGVSLERQRILDETDKETREYAVARFRKDCADAGLNYSIHHDRSFAIQELLHESIYADLLVIKKGETLTHYPEKVPANFVRDLLSEVQCPVLVVPDEYRTIDKIVLLYDGEPSSVYAIRTFSYIFPLLKHLDTEVLSVRDIKDNTHVPDNRLMKEFMKRHYPHAEYTVLKGTAENEIIKQLGRERGNCLVVLGAYRRGMVSRWFRVSMADTLMSELQLPLFIAHNK